MAKTKMHYAWIVAAVTFFILLITAGIRATPSILMVPLQHEFGWTTAAISGAIAINIALFGIIGPFAASFMARYGVRKIVLLALAILACGVAGSSLMHQRWELVLFWGILVGSGTGVTALVLAAVVVNRWFEERRGLVLGVLSAANATGQLVFLPVLARLVTSHGWRSAVYAVAGCAVFVFLIAARSGAQSAERPCVGREVQGVLDSGREFFRLRGEHEWAYRHAPDSGLYGSWNRGSPGGWLAGGDGNF